MADDDLLGKADALMARHRPGQAPAASYAEIPVLDEVVEISGEAGAPPLLTEYAEPAQPDEEQTEALLASIGTELLAELKPRIDALIDERLQQGLAPLIERMFDELRGSLHLLAREIVDDALHRAISRELDRRRSGD